MITATKGFIAYKLSDYYVQPPSLVYDKIFEKLDMRKILQTHSSLITKVCLTVMDAEEVKRMDANSVHSLSWCRPTECRDLRILI